MVYINSIAQQWWYQISLLKFTRWLQTSLSDSDSERSILNGHGSGEVRKNEDKQEIYTVRTRAWMGRSLEALKVNLHHDGFALRGGDVHVRDRPTFRLCRLPLASSRSQIPNSQYPNPKWRPVQGGSYATSWGEERKRAERRGEHGNQLSRVFTWWLVMISDPIYLWIDISLSLTINLQYIKLRWNFFLSANFRDQRTENSRLNLFFLLYGNLKTLIEERS